MPLAGGEFSGILTAPCCFVKDKERRGRFQTCPYKDSICKYGRAGVNPAPTQTSMIDKIPFGVKITFFVSQRVTNSAITQSDYKKERTRSHANQSRHKWLW